MRRLMLPMVIILVVVGASYESMPEDASIKIAAFNIQIFGRTKRGKADVMNVLTKIAREFDVMLVQEIRDSSQTTATSYLERINKMVGPDYAYVRSPRLGRTSSKEAYAFFYNTETVKLIDDSAYVYDDMADGEDDFEREPYIASFRSGGFDFTVVGIHTKPEDAEAEIAELADDDPVTTGVYPFSRLTVVWAELRK